ncbi:MAG: hypothetical protein GY898_14530 [Proteobacteria bacterium]|nr:hypothetical protein [Pseudomonadota bacterium]
MKRALILSVVTLVFALGAIALVPGCGGSDYTPCESDIDCLIVCDCPGGGDGLLGPYPCRLGNCGLQHAEDRDCFDGCGAPPAVQDDDDSAGSSDDDDSAGDDDDDSGR